MGISLLGHVLALLAFAIGALAQDGDSGCIATGMKPYDYSQALCMSFWFYEAQRSGYLPDNNRVPWRGDSALDDGADIYRNFEGGYYDSGGMVKFGFPLAYSVTTLAWGMLAYPEGYEEAGQTEYGRAAIKWATDYIHKCHTGIFEICAQVGDGVADNNNWSRPEDMDMERPSYKIGVKNPGSDVIGETTAALAAASMVFKDVDLSYSILLLDYAGEMMDFADGHRGLYTNSIPNIDQFYPSVNYEDELAWAALWMYKATGDQKYMNMTEDYFDEFDLMSYPEINFYWEDKIAGVYALMAELNSDAKYMDRLATFLDDMVNSDEYTQQGLIFIDHWGSIRHAMGLAFIALRGASLGINPSIYESWAEGQLAYALGSQSHSFIVGFGEDPPTHAYHRAASCDYPPAPCNFDNMNMPDPNPHVLYGGLVGGPTDKQDTWVDNRSNWEMTEVGLDYNSCYSGVLARIIELKSVVYTAPPIP